MLVFRPYSPPPTGDLKLVKRVSDSGVSATGWEFTFKNNSTGETVTKKTGTDGTITLTGLTAGVSYTVTEKAYDGYATVAAQTITIESGKTNTLRLFVVTAHIVDVNIRTTHRFLVFFCEEFKSISCLFCVHFVIK